MASSKQTKLTGATPDGESRAVSLSKSLTPTRPNHSHLSGSSIDSANTESSHAESEAIANTMESLNLRDERLRPEDIEQHLREKRFYLNQVWQLFSALDRYADDGTMEHAAEAAKALADHICDDTVRRFDTKAVANGYATLSEQAAEDVETNEEHTGYLFNIKDPGRYKDWKPDL